jgi:flagellar basal-body rod modification protein FlgD
MVMNVMTTPGGKPVEPPSAVANAVETPKEIEDRFLKLLIAQLKNQDPLSPIDNSQITQQMSQISMVQGISNLNSSMQALVASQSTQAAGLIGHVVLLGGNGISLAGGQAAGAAKLSAAASAVQVDILSAGGSVVDTLDLGARPAGDLSFAWDGTGTDGSPLPEGPYTFRVRATSGSLAIAADTYTAAQVNSVSLSSTGPMLDLSNGSQVALAAVKKIL